jgi:pyruvate formate lyase activating enzyme
MRCAWCCNPESQRYDIETLIEGGKEKTVGRDVYVSDIMPELLSDMPYYRRSGGGITLSGGECLMQSEFVTDVLKLVKEEGISTAVDTSGAVEWSRIEATLPYTDIYLYDIKCASSDLHEKFTGKDNRQILENLDRLTKCGKRIFIRIPVIPGFNDGSEEMEKIARILSSVGGIERLTLMPYHTLGKNKYETLGMTPRFNTSARISDKKLEEYKEIFIKNGIFTD